jgi:ADP-ribose pyrophosphatase
MTTPAPGEPDRRIIYRGRKLDLAVQLTPLADGTLAEREIVVHPGAVVLLPFVNFDHVCMLQIHRWAAGRTLWELPAGTLDPGESPESTAARELREETGYTAARLEKLAEWWVSPGILTERMHLFLCEDLTPGATAHQPDERIQPRVIPWSLALDMIRSGEIQDAKTMTALLLYDLLHRAK